MVSDCEWSAMPKILEAERLGRLGHFFQRGAAVAGGGVVVEDAANVVDFDQLRQSMF